MSLNKFFEQIQRNVGKEEYVCISVNKKFVEASGGFSSYFVKPDKAFQFIKDLYKPRKGNRASLGEVYICFTPLSKKERKKENACDSYIIAMDIDGAEIPKDFPPTYKWQTSPDKYQGIWVSDTAFTPKEQEDVNRRLVAKYGFDPASNDIVHLYRVPKTWNNKYKNAFEVGDFEKTGPVYRKKDFTKHLEDVTSVNVVTVKEEPIVLSGDMDFDLLVEKYQLEEFYQLVIEDRSEWSYSLVSHLRTAGATKEETKFILMSSPSHFVKWKTEAQIDKEVNRIWAKVAFIDDDGHKKRDKVSDPKKEMSSVKRLLAGGKQINYSVTITPIKDISFDDDKDKWLIEGVWADESVGVIGAPSKSFKSTLTINLACAVATGIPFDGRPVKQGAVLILQGENNLSAEKQKIYSITGKEDLPIYYVEDMMNLDQIMRLKQFILDYKVKLLIIDPLYLLFGDGDINKHNDITRKLTKLTSLRNDTGVSIMLVHHSRKLERGQRVSTSDMYGSAFIEGWYESMITLHRSGINTSLVRTYFRNHRSGDKYTMLVNEDMSCRLIPEVDDDDPFNSQVSLHTLNKKEDTKEDDV